MSHHINASAASLALLLVTTPVMATEPWEGKWTPLDYLRGNCDFENSDGSRDNDSLYVYTRDKIEGMESYCDITKIQRLSVKSSWLLNLHCVDAGECEVEGQPCSRNFNEIIMLDNKDQLLTFSDGSLDMQKRCK